MPTASPGWTKVRQASTGWSVPVRAVSPRLRVVPMAARSFCPPRNMAGLRTSTTRPGYGPGRPGAPAPPEGRPPALDSWAAAAAAPIIDNAAAANSRRCRPPHGYLSSMGRLPGGDMHLFDLVGRRDLLGRERADPDPAEGAAGLPGGEAQRLAGPRLDPRSDVPVLVIDGDDLLVVEPAADRHVGDPDA